MHRILTVNEINWNALLGVLWEELSHQFSEIYEKLAAVKPWIKEPLFSSTYDACFVLCQSSLPPS